jgi:hypothetical protein
VRQCHAGSHGNNIPFVARSQKKETGRVLDLNFLFKGTPPVTGKPPTKLHLLRVPYLLIVPPSLWEKFIQIYILDSQVHISISNDTCSLN